jgi:hypothetical protein
LPKATLDLQSNANSIKKYKSGACAQPNQIEQRKKLNEIIQLSGLHLKKKQNNANVHHIATAQNAKRNTQMNRVLLADAGERPVED